MNANEIHVTEKAELSPARFYCDEMLGHLARYLRAAGFDTRLASNGAPDSKILSEAIDENRWFLTQDRLILQHKVAKDHVILLPQGRLDTYAEMIGAHLKLNWLHRPFTRCLIDNYLLDEAAPAQRENVPFHSREKSESIKICPTCNRIYWRGSHSRRMEETLRKWQNLTRS